MPTLQDKLIAEYEYIYDRVDRRQCPFGITCKAPDRLLYKDERTRQKTCAYCWKNYLDKQKTRCYN